MVRSPTVREGQLVSEPSLTVGLLTRLRNPLRPLRLSFRALTIPFRSCTTD